MARVCEVTAKEADGGTMLSNANNKTKRVPAQLAVPPPLGRSENRWVTCA